MQEKIRIAVCEDDDTEREYICSLVERWRDKNQTNCQIDAYRTAEQIMLSFDGEFPYSIYLLDIEMGKISGMEFAGKIRENDKEAVIIFLTGLAEYALDGYEVGAMQYLIKPIREEKLHTLLCQALDKLESNPEKFFVWEQGSEVLKISYDDIWYLEASGHYIKLFYGEHDICWKASLVSIQKEFEQNGFVMPKRGVLLNLRKIAGIGKTSCLLDNGKSVTISRNCYKKVNEAFINFYRNGN